MQKIKTGTQTRCRWAQPKDNSKAILPTILKDLLTLRAQTRKVQKKYPKGSFLWNVYEGLQLAYKVIANSIYGQTGAKTSAIYRMNVAACTTATGRELIVFSKHYYEKYYPGALCIYGDTDSVFIKFRSWSHIQQAPLVGLDAINRSILLCQEGAMQISQQLPRPQNLDFEKAIFPFIIVTKKRYHGHYFTEYGNPSFYPNTMGLVTKRRDNAPIVKHIYGGMMKRIMEHHSVDEAWEFVRESCDRLRRREFPLEQFIITKSLRGSYKNPDQIAHHVLAERIGQRDPGNKPQANDRIAYAYIQLPPDEANREDLLQGDRIETPAWIRQHNLPLDYYHYLTKQIRKPVEQIIAMGRPEAKTLFDEITHEFSLQQQGIDIDKMRARQEAERQEANKYWKGRLVMFGAKSSQGTGLENGDSSEEVIPDYNEGYDEMPLIAA
jgi:DNA polymerase elongation subunit (family B)